MSEWGCETCTFLNSENDLSCVMCQTVRSSTRNLPYTWQWAPNSDQWIPYDAAANEQLERAYQSGESVVSLSEGFFATNRGYSVKFTYRGGKKGGKKSGADGVAAAAPSADSSASSDASAAEAGATSASSSKTVGALLASPPRIPAFTQLNGRSGMIRPVRRLANDDDSGLFVRIAPSQTRRGERCAVCSEEWGEEEEEEEEQHETEEQEGVQQTNKGKPSGEKHSSGSTAMDTAMSPKKPPRPPAASEPDSSVPASSLPSSSSSAPASAAASSPVGSIPATAAALPVPHSCLSLHPGDQWADSSLDNVRLACCKPGHSFHRECIASWIKLKPHCPVCKQKV